MDNIDFIANGQASGEVSNYMLQSGRLEPGRMRPWIGKNGQTFVTVYKGGDPKEMKSYANVPIQTNGTLRRDEWKQLDDAVLKVAEYRLGGVADLVANGLTFDLGNAMGTTVLEWHDVSDAMFADMTMDGVNRSKNDRPNYGTNYLPIPIIHADYEINSRVLAASRNMGNPLDTTISERAARRVNEKLESLLFTSTTYSFGGGVIYSYLSHPDINLVTLTLAWNNASKTGANILTDVLNMKAASMAAYHFGPWMLYIPSVYEVILDGDYDSTTPGTGIRQRIMAVAGIKGIKVVDTLPADTVLLVQMTPDVVRLVRGMGIQNVEWQTEGKMITKYKVMTIQVPQVRSDQEGHSGIVKLAA